MYATEKIKEREWIGELLLPLLVAVIVEGEDWGWVETERWVAEIGCGRQLSAKAQ